MAHKRVFCIFFVVTQFFTESLKIRFRVTQCEKISHKRILYFLCINPIFYRNSFDHDIVEVTQGMSPLWILIARLLKMSQNHYLFLIMTED